MNDPVDGGLRRLSDAVLHEGSLLYPYQPRALKNLVHRFPFGTLYPPAFCAREQAGDAASLALEVLAETAATAAEPRFAVQLRFLQPLPAGAVPHDVHLSSAQPPMSFERGPARGRIAAQATRVAEGVWRLHVEVENLTPFDAGQRGQALLGALASPQLLVSVIGGALVSAIDPPAPLRALAQACRSRGCFPVLVGPPGSRAAMLGAPIILPDYPAVASESPGDLFDATEMDELLTLRLLTLGDDERRALAGEPVAGALLGRAEALTDEQRARLHGVLRRPRPAPVSVGAAVVLRPRPRGDVLDLALAGRRATVVAIEHDLEGRVHVAVTVDDDPGRDLGAHGHRFFFTPEELEAP
jgi:hypothetical protein